VTGLQSVYETAFGAELLRVLEEGQHDAVGFAQLREQFQLVMSRIRSMASLLQPNRVDSYADSEGRDMHKVHAYHAAVVPNAAHGAPQVPSSNDNIQSRIKKDTRKCNYCGEIVHIRRKCPAWKQWLQVQQQAQRQMNQGGLQPHLPHPQHHNIHTAMAQANQANAQFPRSEAGTSRAPASAAALLRQLSQLILQPPNDSATPAPSDNTGHARMSSTEAIVTAVRHNQNSSDVWLDVGSTHHVVGDKSYLFDCTGSHVSSLPVAGGEELW
jgi:hypothetical protein